MKNKKILFLMATVCCLVVAFACFSGFVSNDVTSNVVPRLASGQKVIITGVQNVRDFVLLWSDYDGGIVYRQSSLTATIIGGVMYEFVPPSNISSTDLYVTLLVPSGQLDGRIFYVVKVLYSYGDSGIQYLYDGYTSYQSTVVFYDEEMPAWDTLYIDFAVTWENVYYTALQTEINELDSRLNQALETIQSYETWSETGGVIELLFQKVGRFLDIEILPGVTIGFLVAIPLILGVVFLVLRLVRGE